MIRFAQTLLRRNSWFVAAFQVVLILFAFLFSWLLRFDFTLPYRNLLLFSIPTLLFIRIAAIAQFNLLHGWWRYTGISDALDVIKAVFVGSVGFVVLTRYVMGVRGFPRSVYVLEPLLLQGFSSGFVYSRVL